MVTTVNDAEIKALAGQLIDLVKPIQGRFELVLPNGLAPGEFDDGENLRSLFDARKKEMIEGVVAMTKAIWNIHDRLIEISEKYRETEDDNTVTGADLEALIKQIKEDLPGIQL